MNQAHFPLKEMPSPRNSQPTRAGPNRPEPYPAEIPASNPVHGRLCSMHSHYTDGDDCDERRQSSLGRRRRSAASKELRRWAAARRRRTSDHNSGVASSSGRFDGEQEAGNLVRSHRLGSDPREGWRLRAATRQGQHRGMAARLEGPTARQGWRCVVGSNLSSMDQKATATGGDRNNVNKRGRRRRDSGDVRPNICATHGGEAQSCGPLPLSQIWNRTPSDLLSDLSLSLFQI